MECPVCHTWHGIGGEECPSCGLRVATRIVADGRWIATCNNCNTTFAKCCKCGQVGDMKALNGLCPNCKDLMMEERRHGLDPAQ